MAAKYAGKRGSIITAEMYEQYKGMIWKHALSWHKTTGIDVEELVAQGNLIFCRALEKFDSSQASFSTFLYISLEHGLNSYVQTYKLWVVMEDANDPEVYLPAPVHQKVQRSVYFWEVVERLSQRAQTIVKIICGFPADTLRVTGADKASTIRNALVQHLSRDLGWQKKSIQRHFRELKTALRAM